MQKNLHVNEKQLELMLAHFNAPARLRAEAEYNAQYPQTSRVRQEIRDVHSELVAYVPQG